jgi:hypothetical protein
MKSVNTINHAPLRKIFGGNIFGNTHVVSYTLFKGRKHGNIFNLSGFFEGQDLRDLGNTSVPSNSPNTSYGIR